MKLAHLFQHVRLQPVRIPLATIFILFALFSPAHKAGASVQEPSRLNEISSSTSEIANNYNVFGGGLTEVFQVAQEFATTLSRRLKLGFNAFMGAPSTTVVVVDQPIPASPSPQQVAHEGNPIIQNVTNVITRQIFSASGGSIPTGVSQAYVDKAIAKIEVQLMRNLDRRVDTSASSATPSSSSGEVTQDDLTNNSIDDLSDVTTSSKTSGDLISWNGSTWTNIATSTLGISGGGGGSWGSITGILANQTDLQNILNGLFSRTDWYATTTDALDEGAANLYFTNSRVQGYLNTLSNGSFFSTTSASYFLSQNTGAAFSTTSANYLLSTLDKGSFFSTTSVSYWESQQLARTADDLTNNSIDDLSDVTTSSKTSGDLISWNGSTWTNIATSTLGISGGGGGSWGSITGILANQTDLQNILNGLFSRTDWYATTTDALDEGIANQYFTNTRADARVAAATSTVRGMFSADSGLTFNTGTGVFSLNTAGDWNGTFDGQEGSSYLARANHTGTQLASTISDFASTAQSLFSSSATGLTYTGGTGVFSLTAGYTIPLAASTTEWNSSFANRITSAAYPLQISSNALSLAFGTTTDNTWSNPQMFSSGFTTNASSTIGGAFNVTGQSYFGGNVGIGSSTPSSKLAIDGTGVASGITLGTSGAGYNQIYNNSGALTLQTAGNSIIFTAGAAGSESMRIAGGTGNVGIATTSPASKFSVQGNALFSGNLSLANLTATGTATVGILNVTGLTASRLVATDGSKNFTSTITLANLVASISDVTSSTGTGNLVLSASPTFTGTLTSAAISNSGTITSTGQFLGNTADTVSAPSFAWSGDTNVGLYHPATDVLGLVTSGAERLRIGSTGNVGIGTTNPLNKLEVAGGVTVGIPLATTGAVSVDSSILNAFSPSVADGSTVTTETALRLARNGTYNAKFNPSADFSIGSYNTGLNAQTRLDIRLGNANVNVPDVTVMSILANGRVGIGTTSPSQNLSVQGNGLFSGNLSLASLTATGTATVGNLVSTGLTANSFIYANGSKQLATGSVSAPLSFSAGTLSISQATTGANGYLSSTDWNTFNNKQAALSFTYPFVNSANTVSLAFGTTTANTWSNLQTFTSGFATNASSTIGGAFNVAGQSYFGGNVGIGTTTPTSLYGGKLAVAGPIFVGGASTTATSTFEGNARVQGNLAVGTGTTWIKDNATSTFSGGINLTNGGCFAINSVCVGGGGDTVVRLSAVRTYTSSNTWTKPAGLSYIVTELWGGGGGGGSANGGVGGGGGGGGYVQASFIASSLSSSESVTVGAGGAGAAGGGSLSGSNGGYTSFKSAISNGGGGGSYYAAGSGGTSSGGDFLLYGGIGMWQPGDSSPLSMFGGSSPRGGQAGGNGSLGSPGIAPGGGGNGNYLNSAAGAGGAGYVVIYEYTTVTSGTDLAELYPVSDPTVGAGDIVAFDDGDDAFAVKRAVKGEGRPLAGIIATNPGIVLSEKENNKDAQGQRPVALSGRVPTKVSLENGPIRVGDRITLSSRAGVGMKAGSLDDSVGVALEAYTSETSAGTITVFMNLQQGTNASEIGERLLADSARAMNATSTDTSGSIFDFVGKIFESVKQRFAMAPVATSTDTLLHVSGRDIVGLATTPFIIDALGNVGIGTSTPYAMLSIGGGARIDGELSVGGSILASSINATDALMTSVFAGGITAGQGAFTVGTTTGVSIGTLASTSALTIFGDAHATRFTVPVGSLSFATGSSMFTASLPSEALTMKDGDIDLAALSTYTLALTQDMDVRLHTLEIRLAALESVPPTSLTSEGFSGLFSSNLFQDNGALNNGTAFSTMTVSVGTTTDEISLFLSEIDSEPKRDVVSYFTGLFQNGFHPLADFVVVRVTAIQGYFNKVHAKQICLGETCIDEAKLKILLEKEGLSETPGAPKPSSEEPPTATEDSEESTPNQSSESPVPVPTPATEPPLSEVIDNSSTEQAPLAAPTPETASVPTPAPAPAPTPTPAPEPSPSTPVAQ